MNKWQAWWDKANEVIDAAPNGVDYYWLAARQEGRQTMGAGEARCFWENHVEYGCFRLRSLKGETV